MCLEGCELSVFCSCGFVSAAMAHVFYDVVAVCCAVLVSCAVVCDAFEQRNANECCLVCQMETLWGSPDNSVRGNEEEPRTT